ncbi:MAG: Crp/Fnr family transcriptional regulator [Acidobacteriaceae bacterium]
MSARLFKNIILQALDSESIGRLDLQPLELKGKSEVASPGKNIRRVLFIEGGIGAMSTSFSDGSEVQVGIFGCESVIGASALMGTKKSLNRVYMMAEGSGFECRVEVAAGEFRRGSQFQELVLRYVQAQLTQTAQTAACNARHSISERLSRWLLMCQDRAGTHVIEMTQESLAAVLGAGRPGVSIAAEELQRSGVIEYRRGKVHILNRAHLERVACECYGVIREHLGNYTKVESGFGV